MNFDALLAPISPTSPAGPDLRSLNGTTALTEVRELRREEDPAVAGPSAKTADWKGIVRTCRRALEQESKDLQLAEYLVEGLVRTEGLAGLGIGLRVLHDLSERFWDHLHPGVDAGRIDIDLRGAPLQRVGAGRAIVAAVKGVPLTAPFGTGPALTLALYEEAQRLEDAKRTRPAAHAEMVASGAITGERWQQAFAATPTAHRVQIATAAKAALERLDAVAKLTDSRFAGSADAPSYGGLRNVLEQIVSLFDVTPVVNSNGDSAPVMSASTAAAAGARAVGPIASRQDAVARLNEVVAYLRATEPHSPVSLLVERAVRWLTMPFEELMQDLVKTPDVLKGMRDTLGLPPLSGGTDG